MSYHLDQNTLVSDFEGSTLILPLVSIGNIPQLATDLIIHSWDFERVGSLDDIYVYPFASPIDYVELLKLSGVVKLSEVVLLPPGVSSAVEIYHSAKLKLTVVQRRSPVIPGFETKFIDEIVVGFVREAKFASVLVLDSDDAGLKENAQNKIDHFTKEDLVNQSLESLNIDQSSGPLKEPLTDSKSKFSSSKCTKSLIEALAKVSGPGIGAIKIDILVSYVYEGDNFYDGRVLAESAGKLLGVARDETLWQQPVSWSGAYGDKPVPNAMEEGIFG